ncbi:MAG: hypothetical protein JW924_08365 [Fusobacteriaceae bacterium]|nr:hypothetical protein [Fusobacteriaceae bacterium]
MKNLYYVLTIFLFAIIKGISYSALDGFALIENLILGILSGITLYFITQITVSFEKKEKFGINAKSLIYTIIFSIFYSSIVYFSSRIAIILTIIIILFVIEYSLIPFAIIEKNLDFYSALIEIKKVSKNNKLFIVKKFISILIINIIYIAIAIFLLSISNPQIFRLALLQKLSMKDNIVNEIISIPMYLFTILYIHNIYENLNYKTKIDIKIKGDEYENRRNPK